MGRRWGKTVLGGVLAMNVLRQHGRVAWIAPTYKNTRAPWRWSAAVAAPLAAAGVLDVSKTEKVISTKRGGFLALYSADNIEAILGEAFNLVILDEAARIAEEAWYESIQPTLADADGDAILISTPKGRNWFWREWLRGQAEDAEVKSFRAPSADNPNPRIKRAAELARVRVSDRTYRQEWLAEFIEDGAGVFRNVRAVATAEPAERVDGHTYVIGADWGRTEDATVFAVIDATARRMVHLDRMVNTPYQQQIDRLKALRTRYRASAIVAELNSFGGPLVESLARSGLPMHGFTTTNTTKAAAIDALALAFENGTLAILNDATLIGELEAYESERLPSGAVRYSAPAGLHDDCVIALALAWHGANNPMQHVFDHYARLAEALKPKAEPHEAAA